MFRNPVTDLIVVLVVALLIFGPKRLPMLGRSLGQGLKEFKDSIGGNSSDEEHPALNAADPAPPVTDSAPTSVTTGPPPPASAPPEPESAEVGSSEQRQ
jgi:sec-independent protein translocase protein TatA